MHPLYQEFIKYIDAEDKEKSVQFIIDKLTKKEINVVQVYHDFLAPALNVPFCVEGDEACIWKEHVRTSIIRTIQENCYPFILKEIKEKAISKKNKKIIIASPSDEYHEIGSHIVGDFFTILGFEVILIGANTPIEEIGSAIQHFKPEFFGLSVSNYYHLVEAEKIFKAIKEKYGFKGKIIVGGNAFYSNPEIYKDMGADLILKTFEDIKRFAEGV